MTVHTPPASLSGRSGFFGTRVSGRAAGVVAAVRILAGAFFVLASMPKFPFTGAIHEQEVAEFVRFGFPHSESLVIFVGVAELLGGLALAFGFLTRAAATGLALVMIGAISTAGVRVGGPFHLGVAPMMLVVMIGLIWAGSGALAIDRRLAARGRTVAA